MTNKSEILDQQPPSDESAERAIVGCVLLDPAIVDDVCEIIEPTMLYTEAARLFVGRIMRMSDAGQKITAATIIDALQENGELDRIGGSAYLAECSSVLSTDWQFYAEKIRRMYGLRQIIDVALPTIQRAYRGDDPSDVAEAMENALAAIGADKQESTVTAKDAALDVVLEIDKAIRNNGSLGVPTGFPKFDNNIGGLFAGQLIILAARTSGGKSAMAAQIARYSGDAGRMTLYVSLEMGATELAMRGICADAGVSSSVIRTGRIDADERKALSEAAERYATTSIIFDCRPRQTVASIRRTARRLMRQGLRLLVVDYLQLIQPADLRIKRYEAIGQMTGDLKALARELEIPVLCLAQLSRESEKEGRPRLRHLRESGSIEMDADVVMLLDRPVGGIVENGQRQGDACLDVAKNRSGATGIFYLNWDGPSTSFSEVGACDQPNYEPAFADCSGGSDQW
ncbi:MAG: DnaB-like helicase C-terminal domain-containing protein [Thermoguttaceae bacterium]